MVALGNNNAEVVAALLPRGANPTSQRRMTAARWWLMVAVDCGHVEVPSIGGDCVDTDCEYHVMDGPPR